MYCIKCKKEIDENSLRCAYCNTKVQTVCPVCKTKNIITSEFCSGCGLQLIKYCPECKKANLPSAEKCRKCAHVFEENVAGLVTKSENSRDIEIIPEPKVTEPILEEQSAKEHEPLKAEEPVKEKSALEKKLEKFSVPIEIIPVEEPETLEQIQSETIKEIEETETETIVPESTPIAVPAESKEKQEPQEEPISQISVPKEEPLPEEIDDSLCDVPVYDQSQCKNLMSDAIRSNEKLIIGLSAQEGMGKSTVLKYLFNDLINQNYNWLWGECSANSQISPFGIFQEMFLTFFNCPNFTNLADEFQTNAVTALQNYFADFSQKDISNLFNFLYPSLTAKFEDILYNKEITFDLIEKTLIAISKKAKLVITIDDFDMIDGASYEFLVRFIENGNLSSDLKLVIAYKDKRLAQGYFYSDKLTDNQYQDVHLGHLTFEYADNLVKMYLNGTNPLPEELFRQIYENSKGNSAYIEQILILLNENEAFYVEGKVTKYKSTPIELELPKTIYDVLTYRLNLLQKNFPQVYKTLCTAAIMGNKFNIALLEMIMKFAPADFQNILKLLTTQAYVSQFNNTMYIFKNTLLWKIIYEKAKQSKDFVVINEKIFDVINSYVLSSNALKALVAQNLNQKLLALNIWTENIKLCAYLGDEHLWTLSQKQSLKIVQEVSPETNQLVINNIYERLGKLLYLSKPMEAIEYISYALNQAVKISNIPKIIELSGYLSKSCSLTGNYHGVIESIDTILKLIDKPEYRLETALIKYKKLSAMFSIGNSEEIFNLASIDIIPVVEQALSNLIPLKNIPIEKIYETWLETNLIVANALSVQGNNKCFQILSLIDEIVVKNNVENENYLNRVLLSKALAYSMQGNIGKSEELLIEISQRTAKETVEPEIISQWNFINILNKLLKRDWANIKQDMYSVVTFANNYNDVLVKNLLKIFLGKVLQEEGALSKALDIYNEQVTIFAKEKIAVGALLCWYYIAKITLVTDGSGKALDIAQKALEVAKNPKISNYWFMVLYKRLIAEIFIIKGDLEAAKMYIEKALLIVKNYDMKLQKIQLYQLYAKYLEEMVHKKPANKNTYAQNAVSTYKKSLKLIKELEISNLEEEIEKNYASFKTFCQLNEIKL